MLFKFYRDHGLKNAFNFEAPKGSMQNVGRKICLLLNAMDSIENKISDDRIRKGD